MTTSTDRDDGARLLVAVVAYQGVLADETEAFRNVLGLLPGAHVVTIGERVGTVAGPGGAQEVEVTFDDLDHADVVVVPGGLGAHRHPEIAEWLRRVEPRFVVASSTGSALLAASGLLRGRTAVTHWLAGPLLELHGVTVSTARLEVDDPYITCSGLASAFDAGFAVAQAVGGPSLVREIRQQLHDAQAPPVEELPARPIATARPSGPARPGLRPGVVEVELEHHPPRS